MVSLTVKVVLQGAENDSKYRDVAPLIAMCCLMAIYQKHFVIWPRLACKPACQKTTALLKEFPCLFTLKSLAQVKLRDDRITSCGYLRFAFTFSTSCGFLRLGFWTSCALNFLRINRNFTSFCRLRVLAAQELLAPLLARALFLGCTVYYPDI